MSNDRPSITNPRITVDGRCATCGRKMGFSEICAHCVQVRLAAEKERYVTPHERQIAVLERMAAALEAIAETVVLSTPVRR